MLSNFDALYVVKIQWPICCQEIVWNMLVKFVSLVYIKHINIAWKQFIRTFHIIFSIAPREKTWSFFVQLCIFDELDYIKSINKFDRG